MTGQIDIFDRAMLRRRRDRAAAGLDGHDFLLREVASRLSDRLNDIRRRFSLAVELGCHTGLLARAIGDGGQVDSLVQCDLSPEMAARAQGLVLVADEEALPFRVGSLDLVLSCLSLHWVNDLPGALVQIRKCLKSDGAFLAAMLGGETLTELRQALLQAETEEEGGVSPRVSPFADVGDLGGLLQRAGFALPVVDRDRIEVTYPDALALMRDLRGMGESNLIRDRRKCFSRRNTLFRAAEIYAERFAGEDGRVAATFDVLYLTGWSPDASQQRPLHPGSARSRLADALDAEELDAGDKADPGPKSSR
ncbi:MAG: methyltransferase domain-containing protein [Alphaproteobacteria bacterium]|nr:methyltransferase domain-containing protein [Alphaproteobacteria bacterium]